MLAVVMNGHVGVVGGKHAAGPMGWGPAGPYSWNTTRSRQAISVNISIARVHCNLLWSGSWCYLIVLSRGICV